MFMLQQELQKKSLMKTLRSDLLIYTNFVTMISIILFCFCGKVFPYNYMDDWEKFSENYQRKIIFIVT